MLLSAAADKSSRLSIASNRHPGVPADRQFEVAEARRRRVMFLCIVLLSHFENSCIH
jgi:hypothetical protein